MKRTFLLFAIIIIMATGVFSQRMVNIKGKVTDFSGKPIVSAMIEVKTRNFDMKYHTFSDKNGNYSIDVQEGTYLGISCVRMQDYAKNKLEFWAWNVPAYNDMTINMRYDKLEVYGLNAFRIQGAYRGYTIYCRPMSLTKYLAWQQNPVSDMDLAPDPNKMHVEVTINGSPARVNLVEEVPEFAGKQQCSGYVIYTELGAATSKPYDEIRVTITDLETGEKGESVYYKMKENYIN